MVSRHSFNLPKMAGSSTVKKNIGTQGVQELFFCEFKALGGSNTHWTLSSYDNPIVLIKQGCF